MGKSRGRLLGPLGWRLFAAFTLVGVGAVALLAALAVVSVRSQTSGLVASQRDQARHDIAAALSAAYAKAGSWQKADLAGAQALADSTGARLIILGASGGQVTTITPAHMPGHEPGHEPGMEPAARTCRAWITAGTAREPSHSHHQGDSVAAGCPGRRLSSGRGKPGGYPGPRGTATATPAAGAARVPVMAGGRQVGTVLVSFPAAAQTSAWQARDAILRAVAAGALLAVLLAAAAALWVSRRTTRPLTALAAAAGAVERGDPDAVSLLRPGPGELGQVSAAFAAMAGTLQREDELRRAMVADTAHELRTPVTILRGATEELLDGLAEPTTSKLTSLHDEVLRLERLVDDLSALAAAQSAALTLDRAPADLAKIAACAAGELQAHVRGRRGAPGRGHLPGHGARRPGPPHPDRHQPADQRGQVHPARRARHPHHPPRRRQRGTHRHRHRPRHPRRGPAAHLRTVLARHRRGGPGRHRHRPRPWSPN